MTPRIDEAHSEHKPRDVFSDNGVWVRWLISTTLGLGSIAALLFYLGKWTQRTESDIKALQDKTVVIVGRIDIIEKTIGEGMTIRIKLQKDVEYIREKVDKTEEKQDKILDLISGHATKDKSVSLNSPNGFGVK